MSGIDIDGSLLFCLFVRIKKISFIILKVINSSIIGNIISYQYCLSGLINCDANQNMESNTERRYGYRSIFAVLTLLFLVPFGGILLLLFQPKNVFDMFLILMVILYILLGILAVMMLRLSGSTR